MLQYIRSGEAMPNDTLDRNKLRQRLRHSSGDHIRVFLNRAIERLPDQALPSIFNGFIRVEPITTKSASPVTLSEEIDTFCKASLRGDYFEDFTVNWSNSIQIPPSTEIWIAECVRLFDASVQAVKEGEYVESYQGIQRLIELLQQLDHDPDSIIFMADEGGSWQVCIDWRAVIPAWAQCIARTHTPTGYAAAVFGIVEEFAIVDSETIMGLVHQISTPEQRLALSNG